MNPDQIERDYQKAPRRIREAKGTRATSLDLSGLIMGSAPAGALRADLAGRASPATEWQILGGSKGNNPSSSAGVSQLPDLRYLNISKLGIQYLAP